MAEPRYVTNPDVVYTKLGDEEAVLLHLTTQHYYSINETGVAVWELLEEPRSLDELATALTKVYDVEWDEARAFAESFVTDLGRDNLIRKS